MSGRCKSALRAAFVSFFLLSSSLHAIQPPVVDPALQSTLRNPALQISASELDVTPSLLMDGQRDSAIDARVAAFRQAHAGSWEVRWDSRGDRPNLVQGSGVALIPGRGNTLSAASFGVADAKDLDLAAVAREARRFIDAQARLLALDGLDLRLDPDRSVVYGKGNTFWSIEFAQYVKDVRVDGAFVFVRISNGNVVQFGAERIGAVKTAAEPALTREQAFYLAWQELDFPAGTQLAQMIEPGELRLYPAAPQGEAAATAFAGTRGEGYAHVLAWRYVFRVAGNPATWEVLFDAHANRVIDVRDLDDYVDASVSGGVYPTTNTDPETIIPFPFASVSNGGTRITDTLGIYDYSGGTATTTLNGKYFRMSDTCGSLSLTNSTDGNLNFGAGAGTDCTTPSGNSAGPGNTHASRTGFYHLTRINEKARGILPSNSWLQSKVTANMNLNQTCNAYWDGDAVNFFKSGGGCSNTGEIAAVFLHEWGHGLDQNTGGAANENGSGEAVGDTFAFLETRDACIGENFRPGQVCHNCTICTGVRDVHDFGLDGTRPIARPSNVTSSSGINCNAYIGLGNTACPYTSPSSGAPYRGPMGYEGHCESLIASSANWDLKSALVARFGGDGWDEMDRIWYGSLTPSKSAYQVQSGGTCNPAAVVNGCAATNWYTVYLAADDDDGNLANGTPNACRIWDAFDAHGIACGARPVCSGDAADFSIEITDDPQTVCAPADANFSVAITAQLGFTGLVNLSASGQPSGTSVSFSPNPVAPGSTSTMTVSGTGAAPAGDSTITVSGSAAGSPGHSADAHLTINAGAPAAPMLTTPSDQATEVSPLPTFTWQPVTGAASYTIEVASDAAFATIVASQSGLTTTSWTSTALAPQTQYFWRVRAVGSCGESADPTAFSFTTANEYCSNPALAIPDDQPAGVTDTLTFSDATVLSGVRLKIVTTHTYVGDLKYTLARGASSVVVIDQPECGESDIDVVLDDASTTPVQSQCNSSAPAISGVDKPLNPLDPAFAGQTFGGSWTLNVSDNAGQDTGTLVQWCLEPKAATPITHTVGGSVSGLAGSGLALSLNGGTSLPIAANGGFTFPTPLADGATYAVTVATQPSGPAQTCSVSNGDGSIAGADVTDVAVVCTTIPSTYTVGGAVNGLIGSGLVLSLNGGSGLPIASDGGFTFPTPLDDGASYAVSIVAQPSGKACTLANASGSIDGADVTNVQVTCSDRIFADGFESR
jgi:subtilisin-like proprotein convertase family protein